MLANQMVKPDNDKEKAKIKIKQHVRVDLTGLVTTPDGEEINAFAAGVILDNDTFHGLITVKIDDSIFKPEAVIRVPWERVTADD